MTFCKLLAILGSGIMGTLYGLNSLEVVAFIYFALKLRLVENGFKVCDRSW